MDLNIEIRKLIQELTSFQLKFNDELEVLKKEFFNVIDEKSKMNKFIKLSLDCDSLISKTKSLLINVEEFKTETRFEEISENSKSLLEVNENLLKERLNELTNLKSSLETAIKQLKLQKELK